ncbi:hypothetical protein QYM36_003290 [Artemia franciscana]|uniref:Uncharacterized protein n=1 Tax=Artemia franciscana TaxID=6661 RepID=A0AA88ILQ4_ARTSF|nr:hypothetical protein QYM36_003290 [Artemia franciscana]
MSLISKYESQNMSLSVRAPSQVISDKKKLNEQRFKNNLPGEKWARIFLKRQSDQLSHRFCQNVSSSHNKVDSRTVSSYTECLEETLRDVKPKCIVNYDDTTLPDNPGRVIAIFKRKVKYPERLMNQTTLERSTILAASASGEQFWPYIVFKLVKLWDSWIEGASKGFRFNRSKSGWFVSTCFHDFFESLIVPWVEKFGPDEEKVLIS